MKNQSINERMLSQFFADARHPVTDDGFTVQVMERVEALQVSAAMHQHSATRWLRQWNIMLNIAGVLGGIVLLVGFGFFSKAWDAIQNGIHSVLVGIMTFDPSELLVQLMLFMHRLPELLPSPTQLLALELALCILLVLGVQKLEQSAR